MKRMIAAAALALSVLSLTACAEGRYGYGYGYGTGWQSRPYDVWYDGYYGPFYDGYWGNDGFFYYRSNSRDGRYRRDDSHHFRRGDRAPRSNFRRYEGATHQPPRGAYMPSYPRSDMRDGRDRNYRQDRDYRRDRDDRRDRDYRRDRNDQD